MIQKNSEDSSKNLPQKQKIIIEYKKKLLPLIEQYPKISLSMDDKTLAKELGDALTKVGFQLFSQQKLPEKTLVKNIVFWLTNSYLLLLHYRPQSGSYNLLSLLRAVKEIAPALSFGSLIPVFITAPSSQKQQSIFKSLGNFGIRYVSFLTPDDQVERSVEEVLSDLNNFCGVLRGTNKEETISVSKGEKKEFDNIGEYEGLLAKGEALITQGKHEEAIDIFTKAISMKPSFKVIVDRGDAYYKIKKYYLALNDYRQANKMEIERPKPYSRIGSCCFAIVKEIAKSDKEKAKRWFEIGLQHLKDGEKIIDEIIKKNSDTPEMNPLTPYGDITSALVEADFIGLGLEAETAPVENFINEIMLKSDSVDFFDPGIDSDIQIDHAVLLARGGNIDKAEKLFREVIKKDSRQAAPAFNNFAVELRKIGRLDKAFQIYMELMTYTIPDRSIVMENLKNAGIKYGEALRDEGKPDEAIEVYKNILHLNPNGREWILCELAMTYLEKQEQAQASYRLMEAIYVNSKLMSLPRFEKFKDLKSLREEMMKKLMETA